MSGNFFTTTHKFITAFIGPPLSSKGVLNPTQLAIARNGYYFQSQILRLPDRYGYFSPGPARLQARQGSTFLFICSLVSLATIWNICLVAMVWVLHDKDKRAGMLSFAVTVQLFVLGVGLLSMVGQTIIYKVGRRRSGRRR